MNLIRRTQSVQKVQPIGDYPHDFPELDEDTLRRVPGLAEWYQRTQKWWYDFRTVLRRREQEVVDPVNGLKNFEDQTNATVAQFQTDLTTLSDAVDSLTTTVNGSIPDLGPINAAIAQLKIDVQNLQTGFTSLQSQVTNLIYVVGLLSDQVQLLTLNVEVEALERANQVVFPTINALQNAFHPYIGERVFQVLEPLSQWWFDPTSTEAVDGHDVMISHKHIPGRFKRLMG